MNTNERKTSGTKIILKGCVFPVIMVVLYVVAEIIAWQVTGGMVRANALGCNTVAGLINVLGHVTSGTPTPAEVSNCQAVAESQAAFFHFVGFFFALIAATMFNLLWGFIAYKVVGSSPSKVTKG